MKLHSSCRSATVAFGSALVLAACGGSGNPEMTVAGVSTVNAAGSTASTAAGLNTNPQAAAPGAALVKTSLKQLNRVLGIAFLQRTIGLSNTLTVSCAQGGTATLILNAASGSQLSAGDSVQLTADNCVDGTDMANGAITIDFVDVTGRPSSTSAWNATLALGFNNFSYDDGDEANTANGTLNLTYDQTAARTATFNITSDTLQLQEVEDGVTTNNTLSAFNASGSVNGDIFTYRTGFTLDGDVPNLGNGPYTVATSTDFVQQEGSNPSQGVLQVTASDGAAFVLTALDPVNVNLTVDRNGDGVVDQNTTTTWDELENVV